jgi:DNA-binding response OmpR family regulator
MIDAMRVLLIEDDEDIVRFLTFALETSYFVVDVARDGEAGSFMGRFQAYDMILLDNMLPKRNGKSVCIDIREQGIETPILVLSALSDIETKTDLLNAGADDYMVKPFVLSELLARMRALLRRPKQLSSEVLSIDTLVMDVNRHLVTRNNVEIRLTRKEFILLKYFMSNQNVVLSRGSIMDHAWDMHADPFSNTIESHILTLRKKISPSGERKLIHTISGQGYVMDIRE